MDLAERACTLLASNDYINIATTSEDGDPWNTPVYAVYDQNLSFYWSSWKSAEHSINIRTNGKVFMTIYDSTRKRGDNNRRCLYIQGTAVELDDVAEIESALERLYGDEGSVDPASSFLNDGQRRVYRAIPDHAWLNDKSERQVTAETIKMRIDVPLEEIQTLITAGFTL